MVLHALLTSRFSQGLVTLTDPVVYRCTRDNIDPKHSLEGTKHMVQVIQRSDCRQTPISDKRDILTVLRAFPLRGRSSQPSHPVEVGQLRSFSMCLA